MEASVELSENKLTPLEFLNRITYPNNKLMSYVPTIDDEMVLSDIQTDTDDDSDSGLTQSVPKKISSRVASRVASSSSSSQSATPKKISSRVASSSSSSSESATKTVPNKCKVCSKNEINIALSPCGDVKICESCWLRISSEHSEQLANNSDIDFSDDEELKPKCPCCRQGVETYIKIYFG